MTTRMKGIRKHKTPASITIGVVQYAASEAAPAINAAKAMAYVNLKTISFRNAYNRQHAPVGNTHGDSKLHIHELAHEHS
jgi:hypothetical protein